jgi:hypothetical protein
MSLFDHPNKSLASISYSQTTEKISIDFINYVLNLCYECSTLQYPFCLEHLIYFLRFMTQNQKGLLQRQLYTNWILQIHDSESRDLLQRQLHTNWILQIHDSELRDLLQRQLYTNWILQIHDSELRDLLQRLLYTNYFKCSLPYMWSLQLKNKKCSLYQFQLYHHSAVLVKWY